MEDEIVDIAAVRTQRNFYDKADNQQRTSYGCEHPCFLPKSFAQGGFRSCAGRAGFVLCGCGFNDSQGVKGFFIGFHKEQPFSFDIFYKNKNTTYRKTLRIKSCTWCFWNICKTIFFIVVAVLFDGCFLNKSKKTELSPLHKE